MIKPRTPAGTLELLPGEQRTFNHMLEVIRRNYERFGFLPIETPVFELSEGLLTKTGGETERQVYFLQSTGALEKDREGASRHAIPVWLTFGTLSMSGERFAGMGQVFKNVSNLPVGLVLVTGPTGSGKSTTLAAMIDYINDTRYEHVLTIEDPIEFVHESKKCLVNQREVHRDTLGFNEALRSALREDPDYILVGELRDLETISLALTAAETGHLVFGTLHTSSAAKTIDRIIDVFPAGEKPMVR